VARSVLRQLYSNRSLLKGARPEQLSVNVLDPDNSRSPRFPNVLPPSLSLYLSTDGGMRFSLQPFWRGPTPPQCPILAAPNHGRRSGGSLPDSLISLLTILLGILSILRRNCSLTSRFLTPWQPVGFVRCLSPNAHSLQAPRSTESLVGSFRAKVHLRRASLARRVTIIPAAPNSCRGPNFVCCGPQIPWVRISLKMFLLRHATVAQRDTFLQAATDFSRDLPSPRVIFVGFIHRPAAIRWPLGRFFVLEDFLATSSAGTN
jgi:hypothetical protein